MSHKTGMNFASKKRWCFFGVLLLMVGCVALMMQGMLPPLASDNKRGRHDHHVDVLLHSLQGGALGTSDPRSSHGHHNEPSDKLSRTSNRSTLPVAYKMSSKSSVIDVKHVNFYADDVPQSAQSLANETKVTNSRIKVMGIDMFYREALPPEGIAPTHQNALLLHGMNFKSETWLKLGTINLLAAMGHRVVAFDLPGYGETAGDQLARDKRGEFLNEAIEALQLMDVLVVSPSMSGTFSLPFLFGFPGKMGGYVPVAPVFTEDYTKQQYESVKTPTLIVYGELDTQLGEISTKNLRNLPNSQELMLPQAKHPAYLDQPKMFHQLLYNFFLKLKKN